MNALNFVFRTFIFLFFSCTALLAATKNPIVDVAVPIGHYQNSFNSATARGYRMTAVDAYEMNGVTHFNVVWDHNDEGLTWASYHGMTGTGYQQKFNELTAQGYRLTYVDSYVENNQARYVAIFVKQAGPAWVAYHGFSFANYQAKFDELTPQGYRLVCRSVININGTDYVTALFDKAGVGSLYAKSGLTEATFNTTTAEQAQNGRGLAYLDVEQKNGGFTFNPIYNGITNNGTTATVANATEAFAKVNQLHAQGFVPICAVAVPKNNGGMKYLILFDK